MTEIKRKLASIQKIEEIKPIEGADAIEAYRVLGWWVVSKKDEFKVGDLVCYFEIDSWIPHELAPFLSKGNEPREYNGVKGERLRTIRLRGQVSQGLLLPIHTVWTKHVDFHKFPEANTWDWQSDWTDDEVIGLDVTAILGIQKWEAPLPAQLQGQAKGTFPTSLIPKTDQERCCDESTTVLTINGNKTIKELCDTRSNIDVMSFNHFTNKLEYKKIINHSIMTRKKDVWVLIKTKSGKELKVTKNHKIYLPTFSCYRETQFLKVGDIINILL